MSRTASGKIRYDSATDLEITNLLFRGNHSARAIYLFNCTNVVVSGCWFEDVRAAVVAVECTNVTVTDCTYRHLRPAPVLYDIQGNFVQFDKTDGGEVSDCVGYCDPASDGPEDLVSVFESSDVNVLRNVFEGGGPSASGSGIMLGDNGGSGHVCADNVLINPGQVGIGVAGGSNIQVLRNRVYSSARPNSNVGLYVHNYAAPAAMSAITVQDNEVHWLAENGVRNGSWTDEAEGVITGWAENDFSATLDPSALRTAALRSLL